MNIEQHIIPRPLTNAQARHGIAVMEKQNKAQEEKALRERVDLGNLAYWIMNGDTRNAQKEG